MPEIRVVLVGPKFEGNVGAVARSMANFDVEDLVLVHPCELGDDAWRRAKHGYPILEKARRADTIAEAVEGCFLVAGTSGVTTKGDRNFSRIPVPVHEFAERTRHYDEKIAILFGREDVGLLQDELDRCDALVTVPTSERYPILNLSHAVAIVLHEMFGGDLHHPAPADSMEKELMFGRFEELLDAIGYPAHRRDAAAVMFRKLVGRAVPSRWEFSMLMGIIGDSARIIRDGQKGGRDRARRPRSASHRIF